VGNPDCLGDMRAWKQTGACLVVVLAGALSVATTDPRKQIVAESERMTVSLSEEAPMISRRYAVRTSGGGPLAAVRARWVSGEATSVLARVFDDDGSWNETEIPRGEREHRASIRLERSEFSFDLEIVAEGIEGDPIEVEYVVSVQADFYPERGLSAVHLSVEPE
jgi:hypothetical protein